MRDSLAGFRLLRELRPSAHGMVHLVEALEGGPIHALKLLRSQAFDGEAERDAWLAALRRRLPLDHPNLLRVLACGAHEGGAYVVTQWAERGALSDLLIESRMLPFPISAYLAAETLAGLIVLHQEGQLHGAVKPNNILIGHDGTPLLSEPPPSFSVDRAGSAVYSAPEILRGEAPTPRSDLFSLGAMLYEICCGRSLEHGDLGGWQSGPAQPRPPRYALESNPLIPLRLDRWIRRLLTPDVERRLAAAADALRELYLYRAEPDGRCERHDFQEFLRDPFQYTRQYQAEAALRRLRTGQELAAQGRVVPAIWELHLAILTDRSQPTAREVLRNLAKLHGFELRYQDSAAATELLGKLAADPNNSHHLADLAETYHAQRRILELIQTYLRLARMPIVEPALLSRVEALLGADTVAYLKQGTASEPPAGRSRLPTWETLPHAPRIEAPARVRPAGVSPWLWGLGGLGVLALGAMSYLGTPGVGQPSVEPTGRAAAGETHLGRESVADLFLVRARAAGQRGDWTEAAQIYDRFLRQFPHDARKGQILLQRTAALARSGQATEAIQSLDLIGREQRGELQAAAIEELSDIYLERGERETAKELLAAAGTSSNAAAAPRALFKLGRLFEEDDELTDAIRAYETISMQYPLSQQWPDTQLRLAELFHAGGQGDAARRALEELLDGVPHSSPYRRIGQSRLERLLSAPQGNE